MPYIRVEALLSRLLFGGQPMSYSAQLDPELFFLSLYYSGHMDTLVCQRSFHASVATLRSLSLDCGTSHLKMHILEHAVWLLMPAPFHISKPNSGLLQRSHGRSARTVRPCNQARLALHAIRPHCSVLTFYKTLERSTRR